MQWSKDFRRAYRAIEESEMIFPNAAILTATANATIGMQQEIMWLLNFTDHRVVVAGQSNWDNIKYVHVVKKRPPNSGKGHNVVDSYTSVLAPFLTELKEKTASQNCYVHHVKIVQFANELAVKILSDGTLSCVQVGVKGNLTPTYDK